MRSPYPRLLSDGAHRGRGEHDAVLSTQYALRKTEHATRMTYDA